MTLSINSRGIVDGVSVKPTPNKRGSLKPTLVIVHDTAGNIDPDSSISWLRNPAAEASAHFVIDREGRITQLVSCEVKAWHAGKSIYKGKQNVNDFSIGIEHVNPGRMLSGGRSAFGRVFDPGAYGIVPVTTPHHGDGYWMPYTEAQLGASLSLLLAIRDRYGVDEIAPHWEISPGRKVDTNPLFPLESFRGRLEGRQNSEFLLQTKPGAIFRQWPSFYKANEIKLLDDDGWLTPLKSGTFEVAGDDMPEDIKNNVIGPQLWYQVKLQGRDHPEIMAWIWAGHVKDARP